MKKSINPFRISLLAVLFFSLIFVACEGPAGKDGATGATGPQGPAGAAGATGKSGAEQCGACHNNSSALYSKKYQWAVSLHGAGEAFTHAGSNKSCAACHSTEGFLECAKTGANDPTSANYEATKISCNTCHAVHTKYDTTDWAFTYTAPFALRDVRAGEDANVDLKEANLCAKCHQSRTVSPVVDLTNPTAEVTITSLRYGPHYGSQTNVVVGKGGYKIEGSTSYPTNNVHRNVSKSCIACHMSNGGSIEISGHTMMMATEDGATQKIAACQACHASATSKFNDVGNGYYEEMKAVLAEIETILIAKGWIGEDHYVKATTAAPLKITALEAAALYNYKFLSYDGSHGIHNPGYFKALAKNTLEVLKK